VRNLRTLLAFEESALAVEALVRSLRRVLRSARRGISWRHLREKRLVVLAVPRLIKLEGSIKRVLLDVRQDRDSPAEKRLAVRVVHRPRREMRRGVVVVVHREGDLLQVVGALHAAGGLADSLNSFDQ